MSTTPVLNFDFSAVLASLDPHHSYKATLLSGGLVNLTARVAISADDGAGEHECLVRHTPTSVVAKHAPPYIAAFGENEPFSQFRQTIEARALKLLSQPITNAYIHANPDHNVTHPEFIRHDSSVHVLLMSDIGHDSLMLDQWLLTNPSLELAAHVGERFGMFLARLGGVKNLDLEMEFANPDMEEMLLESYVQGFHAKLLKCGVESTEADALIKLGVDMRQIQESRNEEEKVFGMGDCWVRSILVFGNAIGEEVGLAAIDWEFAGMIEPLADVFQLAATLYLLYQTSPSLSRPTVQACALALIRTHAAQAPRWYYAYSHMVDAWRLFGEIVICNVIDTDLFDGDEQKREAGRKALGKKGTEFMRNAEHMATRGMDAFEMIFTEAV